MRLLFELIAIWGSVAMAFVFGRIWEIRLELRQRLAAPHSRNTTDSWRSTQTRGLAKT